MSVEFSKYTHVNPLTAHKMELPRKMARSLIPSPLAENEEALIREGLKKSGSNLSQTAEELGIARGTLYSKMKKYGL